MSGCTESTNNDTIHKLYNEILNANQKLHSHFNYIKYANIFAFLSFIMTTLI